MIGHQVINLTLYLHACEKFQFGSGKDKSIIIFPCFIPISQMCKKCFSDCTYLVCVSFKAGPKKLTKLKKHFCHFFLVFVFLAALLTTPAISSTFLAALLICLKLSNLGEVSVGVGKSFVWQMTPGHLLTNIRGALTKISAKVGILSQPT